MWRMESNEKGQDGMWQMVRNDEDGIWRMESDEQGTGRWNVADGDKW